MPAGPDLPRYEAFVVQPDKATHWVVAIVRDAARTKARRFARLHHTTDASRLADALNSRLLGRPNFLCTLFSELCLLRSCCRPTLRNCSKEGTDNPGDDRHLERVPTFTVTVVRCPPIRRWRLTAYHFVVNSGQFRSLL